MTRTDKAIVMLTESAGVDATKAGYSTTIDSTLVTKGLRLTNYTSKNGDVFIRVKNSFGANKNVIVRKGVFPRAFADLVVEVAATTGDQIIKIGDGARYKQADGNIHVDFQTGFTGTIEAYGCK